MSRSVFSGSTSLVGCRLQASTVRVEERPTWREAERAMWQEAADLDPGEVVESGKLEPGGVLLVDTVGQRIVRDLDAKREIALRRPYAAWLARHMATLPSSAGEEPLVLPNGELRPLQLAFGLGFGWPLVLLPLLALPLQRRGVGWLTKRHGLLTRVSGVLLLGVGVFGVVTELLPQL